MDGLDAARRHLGSWRPALSQPGEGHGNDHGHDHGHAPSTSEPQAQQEQHQQEQQQEQQQPPPLHQLQQQQQHARGLADVESELRVLQSSHADLLAYVANLANAFNEHASIIRDLRQANSALQRQLDHALLVHAQQQPQQQHQPHQQHQQPHHPQPHMAQYAHAPAHGHAHAHAPAPAPLHPPHQPPPYQHHSPYQQHLPYHPQQQQHPHPQHAQTQQAPRAASFQPEALGNPVGLAWLGPRGSASSVQHPHADRVQHAAQQRAPRRRSQHPQPQPPPQQHHQHQHHQQHQQQQQKQHYSSTPAQHAASPAPAPAPGAQSHTDQTVAAAVAAHQQHAQADASSSQASGSAPRRAGQFLARMALSVPHATHIGSLSAADRTQLAHYLPASMTQLIAESFAFKRQRHLPEPIHSSVRSIQQQLLPHGAKDSTLAQEEELLLLQELRPVRYANVKCGEHIHEWLRHPDVQAWTVMDFIQIYSNALNRIWRWLYKMKLVSNSVTNAAGTIVQFIGRPPGAGPTPTPAPTLTPNGHRSEPAALAGQQPHNPLAHAQRHAHGHAAAATGSSSSTSVSGSAEPHSPSYLDEASHLNGHAGYHHPQDDDDDLGDMGDMDGRDPAQ